MILKYYIVDKNTKSFFIIIGEYKIKLPDGRVQITSYEADDHGYRPTIAYEYPHRPKKIQVNKLELKETWLPVFMETRN